MPGYAIMQPESQYLGCVGEEAAEAGEVRVDALAADRKSVV